MSAIENSSRVTDVFGYWPSFHDAEVLELHLHRGDIRPADGVYQFPTLSVLIHHWQTKQEVSASGYYDLYNHTLTRLLFRDVDEVQLDGFNHQNAIYELQIARESGDEHVPSYLRITFDPASGLLGTFRCRSMAVLESEPHPNF